MSTVRWNRGKTISLCDLAIKNMEAWVFKDKDKLIKEYINSYSKPTFWNLWHPPVNIEKEAEDYVIDQLGHKGSYWRRQIKDIHYVALNSECEFIDVNIEVAKVILDHQE